MQRLLAAWPLLAAAVAPADLYVQTHQDGWVLSDTTVLPRACEGATCTVHVSVDPPQVAAAHGQAHAPTLRHYLVSSGGRLQLSQDPVTVLHGPAPRSMGPAAPAIRVGALYEGWQGPAAYAMQVVQALNGKQLTVEAVLGSNGTYSMADIYGPYGNASAVNDGFYWQAEPALGFYCIYRKRPSEATGLQPDCPNITGVLTAQLAWLNAAGVQFITADGTNLCTNSSQADQIQTRPTEVLFEEWAAARARGLTTPKIAAWQRAVAGCDPGYIGQVLALYNNASYADLLLMDPVTGKKVFFVPDSPDPSLVAYIQANGGRNDILVQEMWANFDTSIYSQGRWGFMSPCTTVDAGTGKAVYSSNAVDTGAGSSACEQYMTTDSNLGSEATVSPSYQLSYGSVPFSAAGKFGTLTLKRQFATVLQTAGRRWASALQQGGGPAMNASALPAYLYMSSWNEWISQPQPNPFGLPYSFSMGLGAGGDSSGHPYTPLFVDTYGTSIARDLEPTVEGGDALYQVVASCVRVLQLARAIEAEAQAASQAGDAARAAYLLTLLAASLPGQSTTACAVSGEVCCAYNESSEGVAVVYSMASTSGPDALVTTDRQELARLTCPGCGFNQVCNAYGGPTLFCVDNSLVKTPAAMRGPFVLSSSGCGAATTGVPGADPSVSLPGRAPVYRCRTAANMHFLSPTPTCDAGGAGAVLESTIGCADTSLSSNMPRALRVCKGGSGGWYHTLDYACEAGDEQASLLGYVH